MSLDERSGPLIRRTVGLAAIVALAVSLRRFSDMSDRVMSMAIIVGGAVQVDSDLRTRCVARFPTYLMGLVGVVSALFAGRLLSSLMIAALAVGCTFWIIHRWRTDALGFGDVLLAPVIALYVGWFKVSNIPLWLLMASSGAALTALMSHRRLVAFVPWLVGIAVATILLTTPATYSG